jgi:uncharacterized integral membrane protein
MKNYLKSAFLVIILLFLTTFGVKNSQPVQVKYYFNFMVFDIPLYGLVYISLLIGFFIGMMVGLYRRFEQRRLYRTLEKENKTLKGRLMAEKKDNDSSIASATNQTVIDQLVP